MTHKFILFLTIVLLTSCKSFYQVLDYKPNTITEKDARIYIEELYYHGIPQKVIDLEITDERIKATFSYITQIRDSRYASSNSIANQKVEILPYSSIQSIKLTECIEGKRCNVACYIDIVTRVDNLKIYCKNKQVARNFIDALEYFKTKTR